MFDIAARHDPFDESLWGEYARMLLVVTSACTAAVWALRLAIEPFAVLMVIANILLMSIAISHRFAGLPRLAVLSLLAVWLIVAVMIKKDIMIWLSPPVMFSPAVTIGALIVLAFRDGLIAMGSRTKSISTREIIVAATILAATVYMIVIPGIDAFLEMFRVESGSYTIEELSPLEVLRIRSSKLAVFVIFAYAGACVGSFLNVVAASAPLKEPIALRSSACPQCGTPIRRVDNLPIISYLRLRGRCRDCDAVIPIRYFIVELVGFAIFASLFLYELVTGATNVPGFQRFHYAGILWIILYTKWPVVGIYFLHCSLFSSVLTLALMEQDRLRAPRWMSTVLLVGFFSVVVAFPAMLSVSLTSQTPFQLRETIPDWLDGAATSALGGLTGFAVGHFARNIRLRRRQSSVSLSIAFALLGISLGWQAVMTIAVIWVAVVAILKRLGGRRVRPRWLTATTLLFVVAMLHHPAWKWLADHLSFRPF